jgi:DNA-binding transcriptional regulator YiaG
MKTVANRIFPADKVKALRESCGWTQHQLAEYLDVSRPLVALWETGDRTPSGPAAILLSQLQSREALAEKSLISA